jgi:hypothetical protein
MMLFGVTTEDGRNLALIFATFIGAFIGLPLAIWRSVIAHKQVRLAEAGQNADRYQKGAAMLGDGRLSVREAGIFALSAMVKRDPETYYLVVQKLFCSFMRDRSREQKEVFAKQRKESPTMRHEIDEPDIAPDVQTALTEFVNLRKKFSKQLERGGHTYDLRGTNFRNGNLIKADLRDAYLQGADLWDAYLQGADLRGAELRGADFWGTDLTNAIYDTAALRTARHVHSEYLPPEADD